MLQHQYQSCRACHIGSAGGNLNPYGRLAAKSILPTFQGEEIIETPKWLSLGAHVRTLQSIRKNENLSQSKFFLMQADLSLSLQRSSFEGTITYGKDGFREYYGRQNFGAFHIRVGKYLPIYGLTIDNHSTIRRPLGFGENTERLSAEIGYEDDHFELLNTITKDYDILGRYGVKLGRDIGLAGVSYRLGTEPLIGAWGMLVMLPVSIMVEADYGKSLLSYIKLDWEVIQGLHLYAVNYGGGVSWFPVTHWQIEVEVNQSLAWGMVHFYL